MEEYILETNTAKDWQMKLNQWRHNYHIQVLSMVHCSHETTNQVTVLIKRTAKPPKSNV